LCTPEAVREVMNTLSPDLQSHNQMLGLMQDQVSVVADAAPRSNRTAHPSAVLNLLSKLLAMSSFT